MDSARERVAAGHLRPQGGSVWGGVVHGLHGSAGDTVSGATIAEACDAGSAAAEDLGWLPPLRWDGPDADGCHTLTGTEPPPLGAVPT